MLVFLSLKKDFGFVNMRNEVVMYTDFFIEKEELKNFH